MVLDAGETETLSANWTYSAQGEAGLDCYVEEPFQFIDSSPFITKNVANSTRGDGEIATGSWDNAVLDDDGSILLMLAGLGLTVIIGLVVAIRFATAESEDAREINYESSDDDRVDRFAEMMDEEDEDDES